MASSYSFLYPSVCILRSKLKHFWLDNQVCDKTVEEFAFRCHHPDFPEFLQRAREHIEECRQLEACYARDASPGAILGSLPDLDGMPSELRARLVWNADKWFLEKFDIPARVDAVRLARIGLTVALDRLEHHVKEGWNLDNRLLEEFLTTAEVLRDTLDALPRIVPTV